MADQWKQADNGSKQLSQLPTRPLAQKAQLANSPPQNQPQKHSSDTRPSASQTLSAQQLQQLKEQQIRQARAKLGPAAFASTSQEILRKFAKYPPSLTFHIYDTHYRFNNTQDSSIIPKESPMARSFLKHIIREEIPVEMTELLKDFAIRFYDGCLVLQVYDHRDMVAIVAPNSAQAEPSKQAPSTATTEKGTKSSPKSTSSASQTPSSSVSRPKTYRTLLRPTPQSLYYDLLYHTDSTLTKFTDFLALQMEAEILTLTNRKLDLAVPLNPYLQDELLQPEIDGPKAVWNEKIGDYKVIHSHREATDVEVRKLHEDQMTMQKSSEFDEMMFLLSGKYKHPSESTAEKKLVVVGPTLTSQTSDAGSLETTPSMGATAGSSAGSDKTSRAGGSAPISSGASVLANGSATSNQFMRLRFIEEIRKRKESQKAQAGAAVAAHTQTSINPASITGAPANGAAGAVFQRQPSATSSAKTAVPNARPSNSPPAPSQNQFQQNQQFQKQQVANRQASLYAQQSKVSQQGFPAASPQIPGAQNAQRPISQEQGIQGMTPRMGQDFGASPLSQNARVPQGIARQNPLMQNNQKLGQPPVQQQQLAKQADRIRAQQFQVQQARQQQQQQMRQQSQPQQSPQPSPQNYTQLKQSQQAAQMAQAQAAKRQKLGAAVNQMQQGQYPQPIRTPQMGNLQPGSNANTPNMGSASLANGIASSSPQMANQMPQLPQSAQAQASYQQTQQSTVNNRPASQPALNQAGQAPGRKSTLQQQQQRHQHQQIFQMTLSPEDQHTFRQLQARMNTLVQMSNTGVAPNRTRLTPQQQQQAIQQAKHMQQQLLQRFPLYFQRLRQYQALQDERSLAMQRQQGQPQSSQSQPQPASQARQQIVTNTMGMADGQMYGQQNVGMNTTSPALQHQMMSSPMMPQAHNGMQPGQGKQ